MATTRRRRLQLSRVVHAEVGEAAGGAAARLGVMLGPGELDVDALDETGRPREAEQVVDAVLLAPGHQRLPREAAVGPQHDPHPWPARADLADDPGDLLDGPGRGVDVRAPQLRRQQMPAAEDVERQVAVAVVVAVEEPSLLVAVQRVVGGVEVEHDLLRRAIVGVEEEVHEQCLDRRAVMGDPAVAVGGRRAVLEPVQRALAGERRAAAVPRLEPAERHPEHRIVAQPVVVDQVLVAERDAEHPLPDQCRHLVHHPFRRPTVGEAGREALDEPDRPVGRPEQQPAGVRGDRTPIEIRHHRAAIDACKSHRLRATLCRHRGALLRGPKSLLQKHFPTFRTPMHLPLVRNAGFCNGPSNVNRLSFIPAFIRKHLFFFALCILHPAAGVLLLSAVGARPLHDGI